MTNRGCAVPIRWKILSAGVKHPWKPEWEVLLKALRGRVPATWTVIVLANRGLYARWFFETIVQLGWHSLLRVNGQGSFRPEGWYHWHPFGEWVPEVGRHWEGRGSPLAGRKRACHVPC